LQNLNNNNIIIVINYWLQNLTPNFHPLINVISTWNLVCLRNGPNIFIINLNNLQKVNNNNTIIVINYWLQNLTLDFNSLLNALSTWNLACLCNGPNIFIINHNNLQKLNNNNIIIVINYWLQNLTLNFYPLLNVISTWNLACLRNPPNILIINHNNYQKLNNKEIIIIINYWWLLASKFDAQF
jgi:hypothetical protein